MIANKGNSITNAPCEIDVGLTSYIDHCSSMVTESDNIRSLTTVSMVDLYDKVYENKPPLIDGLLYPGTYLFVGAPKLGKSFLAAQIAYHVSAGIPMWDFGVKQARVLFLALEDGEERLQQRLYRMFGDGATENLHFSISSNSISNGLELQLVNFINMYPDTKLIIIDTLQRVREASGDSYSYSSDYQVIASLKQFADRYGICLLLIHHTRKQGADDKLDMISGTNGLLGAADGAFLLCKERRTSDDAMLEISGRDQPDQRLCLKRNTEKLTWELVQAEKELWQEPPEPILEQIAKKITKDNPIWQGTPTALCEYLEMDIKANSLTLKLNVLVNKLKNEYGIVYKNSRTHDGRRIVLKLDSTPA